MPSSDLNAVKQTLHNHAAFNKVGSLLLRHLVHMVLPARLSSPVH
jgi:hypothetical protein